MLWEFFHFRKAQKLYFYVEIFVKTNFPVEFYYFPLKWLKKILKISSK